MILLALFLLFCLSLPLMAGLALEAPIILPVDEAGGEGSHRIVWVTEPGIEYELQQSPDLKTWTLVPGFPREAFGLTHEYIFDATADRLFFRVRPLADAPVPGDLVEVQGGIIPAAPFRDDLNVETFHLGHYEVTWSEWREVRSWAVVNGYDIDSTGDGCADNHPVHTVNWADVMKWCNAKSEMGGLTPVYTVNGSIYRAEAGFTTVPDWNLAANGFRLPTEVEWEFAARGGTETQGYTYSGSDELDEVGWYLDNSSGASCNLWEGRGSWPVGQKAANELDLYDMSGNVGEWCWNAYRPSVRGGSWKSVASYASFSYPYYLFYGRDGGDETGFRLARSAGRDSEEAVIHVSGDLSFGQVRIGKTSRRILTITNRGKSPLSVTEITYPKGFSGDWNGGSIAGHSSSDVTVTFSPFSVRTYSGNVTVQSDAGSGTTIHAASGTGINNLISILGGELPAVSNLGELNVADFFIGQYEVTWREWQEVREWSASNGYDLAGRGDGCAAEHPVHSVNWYDAVKWCNAKSEMEGLTPVYTLDGGVYRNGQMTPVWNPESTGFRLPMEAEWEFAARGGTQSRGYTYSGSNDSYQVAWYQFNSAGAACDLADGRGTWQVGRKRANELQLYDMSGNVWEWCWERKPDSESKHYLRGSSWNNSAVLAKPSMRAVSDADYASATYGFRLARNAEE